MRMAGYMRSLKGDESGIALVMVLMFMMIMSILATVMYTTTSTEVKVARNFSWRQNAFYAAERGLEYAQADTDIYNIVGTSSAVQSFPMTGVDLSLGTGITGSDASGTVEFLASGNPPIGSGNDITKFKGLYYVINSYGEGVSNSEVHLETSISRIVPK